MVVDARRPWVLSGRGLVWNWALAYAMALERNAATAQRYLESTVPQQLWYQVSNTARERYVPK